MTTETLPAVAPIEPTTPIKPSEAIRLGCLTTRQGFGLAVPRREVHEACAIEAAILGGFKDVACGGPLFREVVCPDPDTTSHRDTSAGAFGAAVYVIVHLNDDHHWSRERIADWLEGLGL